MNGAVTAFGLLLLASLISGCVVTRPTDPYVGYAAHRPWQSSGAAATRPQAAPSVSHPLTLAEAIAIALDANPEVAATAQDVRAAEAGQRRAAGERLPSLHAVADYTRFLDSQRLIPATRNAELGAFSRNLVGGGLVLRLPLFAGGRISSEIEAAERLQESAEHRLARTREELVFEVSNVFYGILAQQRVIESLEFSRATLEEHLKRIGDLIAARKAARVDQLRTEVRVADLVQRRVQEENALAIQQRVLANLLGRGGSEKPIAVSGELVLAPAALPRVAEAAARALERRSDYRAARAAVEAQARRVDVARAGHWPTVALEGAYGGRWGIDPTDRPHRTDILEDVGHLGVVVVLPLFEGGQIEAEVQQERARLAAAQQRLHRLELGIQLDVETALLNIDAARQRVAATQKAIEQGRESLRVEREKYEVGKGAIVDVLDAQSALLDSQTNYYRALAGHSVALAQWRLAMGEP